MKRRGLASPDNGYALALTFAYPVAMSSWGRANSLQFEYDPFHDFLPDQTRHRSEYDPFGR